jgi:hypothetical protein
MKVPGVDGHAAQHDDAQGTDVGKYLQGDVGRHENDDCVHEKLQIVNSGLSLNVTGRPVNAGLAR